MLHCLLSRKQATGIVILLYYLNGKLNIYIRMKKIKMKSMTGESILCYICTHIQHPTV